jgi:hypothetical protein
VYIESGVEITKGTPRFLLVEHFQAAFANANTKIGEWQEKLAVEPEKAMEWGDRAFMAVAQRAVFSQVLHCLRHFSELQEVVDTLNRSILDGARYINNKSTNVSANFLKECRVSELVQAMELVKNHIR